MLWPLLMHALMPRPTLFFAFLATHYDRELIDSMNQEQVDQTMSSSGRVDGGDATREQRTAERGTASLSALHHRCIDPSNPDVASSSSLLEASVHLPGYATSSKARENADDLLRDAERREAEAIAQAQAELDELELSVSTGQQQKANPSWTPKPTDGSHSPTTMNTMKLSVSTKVIPSNASDEWENMTVKKAYIENWLQDPLFPENSLGSPTSPYVSPNARQADWSGPRSPEPDVESGFKLVKKTRSRNKRYFFKG